MFQYEVIHFEDNLYKVVRKLKDEPTVDTEDLKIRYNCNMTLRKQGILYFCNKIEDAIILPDESATLLISINREHQEQEDQSNNTTK